MKGIDDEDLVSIVIPTYNAAEHFAECIASALWQSHRKIEVIVINDCSTDNSLAIAETYGRKDSRVIIHTFSRNMGVAAARDYGIEIAKGKFIAFLDSDDVWHPDKICAQLKAIEAHGSAARAVYCELIKMDEIGMPLLKLPRDYPAGFVLDRLVYSNLTGNGSTVMLERSLAKELAPFVQNISCEDWDYALRIAKSTEFAVCSSVLVGARVLSGSRSANRRIMLQSILKTIDANRDIFEIYRPAKVKALWCASFSLQGATMFRDRCSFLVMALKFYPMAVLIVITKRAERLPVHVKYYIESFRNTERINTNLFQTWKSYVPERL